MNAALLTLVLLAPASSDMDARAALALSNTTPAIEVEADDRKCKRCQANCDCDCQKGDTCRCLEETGKPDADGWMWKKKEDGFWYQWRYVTLPSASTPTLHYSRPILAPFFTAPTAQFSGFSGGNCVGGG